MAEDHEVERSIELALKRPDQLETALRRFIGIRPLIQIALMERELGRG